MSANSEYDDVENYGKLVAKLWHRSGFNLKFDARNIMLYKRGLVLNLNNQA